MRGVIARRHSSRVAALLIILTGAFLIAQAGLQPIGRAGAETVWEVTLLDTHESPIAIYSTTSIAVDSSDAIHIGYRILNDSGSEPWFDLKYALKTGPIWDISRVDGAGNGFGLHPVSVALNSSDSVHIAYTNVSYGIGSIRLADGGPSGWNITEVSADGEIGTMCLDSQGYAHFCIGVVVEWTPMLAYSTNTGGSWSLEVIQGTEGTYYASIAVDSEDHVHMFYTPNDGALHHATNSEGPWKTQLIDESGRNGRAIFHMLGTLYVVYSVDDVGVKLAWLSEGVWSNETVESSPLIDGWPSIAVDALNGIHLCYAVWADESSIRLMYAHRSDTTWTKSVVEQFDSPFIPYLGSSSIATDSLGYVHIAYTRGLNSGLDTGGGVKYATNAHQEIPEMNPAVLVPCLLASATLVLALRRKLVDCRAPDKES